MHWMKTDWLRGCEWRNLCEIQYWTVINELCFLLKGICQLSRTEKFVAIQFHARKKATLTSHYNGWLRIPNRVAPVNWSRLETEKTREGKSDNWSVISNAADSVRDQKSSCANTTLCFSHVELRFVCESPINRSQFTADSLFRRKQFVSWLLWYILSYFTHLIPPFSPNLSMSRCI